MERSKVRLLMRDIAVKGVVDWKVTSKLLDQSTLTTISFIGSRRSPHIICPRQQTHTPPVHDHNISRHDSTPYDTCLLLFPCIHFFMFHIHMSSPSLQLTWLADPALVTLVYPNWTQYMPRVLQEVSLLDGVDAGVHGNGRRFSKTSSYPPCCRYAFTLFYPYFLTTLLSPLFSLIHLFPRPTSPLLYLMNHSHTLYPLCSPIVSFVLLDLETSSKYGRIV